MKLYIAEYNVYGDVSVGLILEPSHKVQEIKLGEISSQLDDTTRVVTLFAEGPCRVQFLTPDEDPDISKSWPVPTEYETPRLIHMGTKLRVATFERD